VQLLLEKGFGCSPGILKTGMALGWSLPLGKSEMAVVKLPWRGGNGVVTKWIGWGSRSRHFDVFAPITPLVKEFELPAMGGGRRVSVHQETLREPMG
jgi:hypothetical protein